MQQFWMSTVDPRLSFCSNTATHRIFLDLVAQTLQRVDQLLQQRLADGQLHFCRVRLRQLVLRLLHTEQQRAHLQQREENIGFTWTTKSSRASLAVGTRIGRVCRNLKTCSFLTGTVRPRHVTSDSVADCFSRVFSISSCGQTSFVLQRRKTCTCPSKQLFWKGERCAHLHRNKQLALFPSTHLSSQPFLPCSSPPVQGN